MDKTVEGETAVYGVLASLEGGRATLALRNGAELVAVVDDPMARQLAARLYDEVGIEGVATWRLCDWQMVAFRATRLTEYDPKSTNLVQTFRDLARASGGRWDGVDAEQYVRELRSG